MYWHKHESEMGNTEPYIRFIGALSPDSLDSEMTSKTNHKEGLEEDLYRFVICMTPSSSWGLLRAQYLQSDIAFRRVVGYEEFKIGGWDAECNFSKWPFTVPNYKRAVYSIA